MNWSDLQSTINGDWKIAIADFAAGDEGILQKNWDVTITYTSPTLATGVWSPTNGLFTDAGLTTPYTGTAVNTVYAAPTTTTTYSVIVSTQICTTRHCLSPSPWPTRSQTWYKLLPTAPSVQTTVLHLLFLPMATRSNSMAGEHRWRQYVCQRH